MRMRSFCTLALLAVCLLVSQRGLAEEAQDAARLFPSSTLVYLDLRQPGPLLDYAFNPDVLAAIIKSEQYQQAQANGQIDKLKQAVAHFEGKMGTDWQSGLRKLIGGGMQIGFDPVSMGPLLVVRAQDAEFLKKLHASVVETIEADRKNRGEESPIKTEEFRGYQGYSFAPGESHVLVDNLLLISNRPQVLKRAIDRKLDGGKSLADVAEYQQAREMAGENPTAWTFLQVEHVRNLPGVDDALDGTKANPALEILFGGILETIKKSPIAVGTLQMELGRAKLSFRLPRDASQVAENRRWHFAAEGGQAARPLLVKGHIATFSTFRNLEGMWNAREELFNEEIGRNLTQAESQLALFFGKQDFGAEVLAEFKGRTTVVVAKQEFPAGQPVPTNRLPAFALVLELKNPEDMSYDLLSVYQKIVALANLGGGQQGYPPLLLSSEDYRGVQVSKGTYRYKSDTPKEDAAFQFNFSPSCALIGERFVIGSTTAIVRDLIDLFQDGQAGAPGDANTLLEVDGRSAADALELNREFFVSQQMLSQGKTHDEAAQQIGTLFGLLRGAVAGRIKLIDTAESLDLEVSIGQLP
ncbi:MAG: DUF3352 domain-containing protein [Pirellulales bacterium]